MRFFSLALLRPPRAPRALLSALSANASSPSRAPPRAPGRGRSASAGSLSHTHEVHDTTVSQSFLDHTAPHDTETRARPLSLGPTPHTTRHASYFKKQTVELQAKDGEKSKLEGEIEKVHWPTMLKSPPIVNQSYSFLLLFLPQFLPLSFHPFVPSVVPSFIPSSVPSTLP